MPTPIYHITHIKNLPSIATTGLLSYKSMQVRERKYINIAYQNIQDRRATTMVPCSAGGTLHDYVPFYFAPRSPMLYTIHKGNVPGYSEGQTSVVHLVSTAEIIQTAGFTFAFTDGHAIVAYSEFFDNFDQLDRVDWEIMKSTFWADTQEDNDRKRRRQAEFLVRDCCPWKLIKEIGVANPQVMGQVRECLQNFTYTPPIKVYANWYY
ncbi:MAG: DUF4433 domain-containing protein [Cyanobacteriota bacterium]|nr:DUF4433 domain-containing protein [Cyanobacteriota bacterium]